MGDDLAWDTGGVLKTLGQVASRHASDLSRKSSRSFGKVLFLNFFVLDIVSEGFICLVSP